MNEIITTFDVGDVLEAIYDGYLFTPASTGASKAVFFSAGSRLTVVEVLTPAIDTRRLFALNSPSSIQLSIDGSICSLYAPNDTWSLHFRRVPPLTLLAEAGIEVHD